MRVVDLIVRKRDGGRLSKADIDALVEGITSGATPEYQTAALLMAIVFRGLDADETAWLTDAMVRSGRRVDLSAIRCPTLAVTFEHDHIVPKESAQILLEKIGTDVRKLLHLNGGHVGAVVSRRARTGLWAALSEWFILHGKTTARSRLQVLDRR